MARQEYVVPILDRTSVVEAPALGTPGAPCFRGTVDMNFSHKYTAAYDPEDRHLTIICGQCGVAYQITPIVQ